jgi:hypothetical protein
LSKISLEGNVSGSGTLTIAAPNTNSNFTLSLPSETGTIVTTGTTTGISASAISTGTLAAARLPAGSVLQVVSTTKTDTFSTSSTSFVDVTGLSVSLTPSSASNKIYVVASLCLGGTTFSVNQFRIVRGSTAIAVPSDGTWQFTGAFYTESGSNAQSAINAPVGTILDSPNTTSSVTYKIQMQTNNSPVYLNRRAENADFRGVSTLTIMEIAA